MYIPLIQFAVTRNSKFSELVLYQFEINFVEMAVKVMFDVRVLLVIVLIQNLASLSQLTVPLVDFSSHSTCPVAEQHKSNLQRDVTNTLRRLLIPKCGNGLWYRVAYLNMSDPSQQCPPA